MRSNKYTLTFFTYVAIALTLALTTSATLDHQVQRRDHHTNLKRMVYKRIPLSQRQTPAANTAGDPDDITIPVGGGNNGAGNAAGDPGAAGTSTSAAAAATSAATTSSAAPTTTSAAAATTLSAATSNSSAKTSSQSSSGSSTSSSATPTSSSASGTSSSATPTSSVPAASIPVGAKTTSGDGAINTSVSGAANGGSSTGMSRATVTILIVIASSIVGAGVIWTVIRKWKFRPSSDFDARMQPIDWNPSGNADDDVGIPGSHRRHSGSSFQSGMGRSDNDNHGLPLPPVPDHDFTAGPAHVGGYHDMARGPPMQEMGRGPAMYAQQYPQQGYPQQDAYGGHY